MENSHLYNVKSRVILILEEIEKVNRMIELSYQHKDELAMLQYNDVKNRFLLELEAILFDLKIEADLRLAA